jgi:Ser/Thr protein kinase RdoA (MazF antagonist)
MDNHTLIDVLQHEYGLCAERLTYLKQAWVAHCYALDCAGGERFFVKFYQQERQARLYARDLEFYLSASDQLAHKQLLPHIAHPVPALSGRFAHAFDGHLLILLYWIEGQTVGFERLADDVLAQAATLVGRLHASTPQIEWPDPPRERFDLPFEDALLGNLGALERITSVDTPGKQGLRALLLPRRGEILRLLERLKELQALMREKDHERVLCHTDLHGGNMMLDAAGVLHLVDWENAVLAPPEHDLHFFEWDERFAELFLPRYERAFRPVRLDDETFCFYDYRRNLEDLAEWVVRILYEDNGDEQDQIDLEGIAEDCISGWPDLK